MEMVFVIFQIILEALAEARPRIFAGALIIISLLLLAFGHILLAGLSFVASILVFVLSKP